VVGPIQPTIVDTSKRHRLGSSHRLKMTGMREGTIWPLRISKISVRTIPEDVQIVEDFSRGSRGIVKVG